MFQEIRDANLYMSTQMVGFMTKFPELSVHAREVHERNDPAEMAILIHRLRELRAAGGFSPTPTSKTVPLDEPAGVENLVESQPDTPASGDPSDNEVLPKPIAESASKSVKLFLQHQRPIVNGIEKETLTKAQYNVILALLKISDKGLTKDALDSNSGHGDSRKILKRLSNSDSDWESVISLPGSTGKGYRIP